MACRLLSIMLMEPGRGQGLAAFFPDMRVSRAAPGPALLRLPQVEVLGHGAAPGQHRPALGSALQGAQGWQANLQERKVRQQCMHADTM